jgi:hypothetical protein
MCSLSQSGQLREHFAGWGGADGLSSQSLSRVAGPLCAQTQHAAQTFITSVSETLDTKSFGMVDPPRRLHCKTSSGRKNQKERDEDKYHRRMEICSIILQGL